MDMAGNVNEWVADWMVGDYYTYYEPNAWPANPLPRKEDGITGVDDLYKVIRGGSWNTPHWGVRVSYRTSGGIDSSGNNLGFRCAANP